MTPVATVVVPTHDHGATLRYSVASVLQQTIEDLELVIVGDGMPPEAAHIARGLAAQDERARLVERPKGPRHGEVYRHTVLAEARGRHVFYLSDDDLWIPDHIERLSGLLDATGADFAATRPAGRLGDGSWVLSNVDLSMPFHREAMLSGFNRIGLSDAGHTLAAYRRLPHGWRTTPRGTPTDLHMWQQWLSQPWARFASSTVPTVLHFPSHERRGWTVEERLSELDAHRQVLTDAAGQRDWLTQLIADGSRRAAWLEAHWQELEAWLQDRQAALDWHASKLEEAAASIAELNARLVAAAQGQTT